MRGLYLVMSLRRSVNDILGLLLQIENQIMCVGTAEIKYLSVTAKQAI